MVFPSESMVDWEQELAAARTKREHYMVHHEAGDRLELKILSTVSTD